MEKRSYPGLESVVTLDLGRPSYLTPYRSHDHKTSTIELVISRRVILYSVYGGTTRMETGWEKA